MTGGEALVLALPGLLIGLIVGFPLGRWATRSDADDAIEDGLGELSDVVKSLQACPHCGAKRGQEATALAALLVWSKSAAWRLGRSATDTDDGSDARHALALRPILKQLPLRRRP